LLRWFRGLRARPDPLIDSDRWRRVVAGLPWVAALDAERQARLSTLAARFLATKAIMPVDGPTSTTTTIARWRRSAACRCWSSVPRACMAGRN
jgi:Mlc titration factor MtfA (ptsG expression regulator)